MSDGFGIMSQADEWAGTDVSVSSSDAQPSANVPWYEQVMGVIGVVGKAATGIIQTTQGVYVDQYGRVVASKGEPVYNYAPSGTLGGVMGGATITSLLLIVLGFVLVLRLTGAK